MRKFVPQKKSFVPASFCRRATLIILRTAQTVTVIHHYHGVGNVYLINSKKLQIGIGISNFSIINSRNCISVIFGGQSPEGG